MLNKIQSIDQCQIQNQITNSKFKQYVHKVKTSIFDLFVFFLKNNHPNERIEILKVIIELVQITSHPFDNKFSESWGSTPLFEILHRFFVYSKLIPFIKGDSAVYLILYYILVLFILFVFISFIYQASTISLNRPINWLSYYKALGVIMHIIPSILFLPIFEFLYSIFVCFNGNNSYNNALVCWKGIYILHGLFGGIAMVLFLWLAYISTNMLFEIRRKTDNYSAKKLVKTDNILLFTKCLIILTCPLGNYGKMKQLVIALNCIYLSYLAYSLIRIKPYYCYTILKSHYIFAISSSWTFLILFIAILVNDSRSDSSQKLNCFFEICLLGNALIIIGIVLTKSKMNIALMLKSEASCPDELIDQLNEISRMIATKEKRTSRVILDGYVHIYNAKCIFHKTPLKNFTDKDNDKDDLFYLMYHLNSLYQNGISKYPHSIRLRISYAIFLYEKLYKRNKALIEIENIKRCSLNLSEEFTLYRLTMIFNDSFDSNMSTVNLTNLTDPFINYQYKDLFDTFKVSINKSAMLYIDFWNHLLNPQHDNQKQLSILNDIGTQINKIVNQVHNTFNKITNIKPYDHEVLLYYTHFANDILNNDDLYQEYKLHLLECDEFTSSFDERNLCHINLNNLSTIENIQFVIISAMPESLGVIRNISTSLCSILGYLRQELIGKRIEVLLPDMFIDSHSKFLSNVVNKYHKSLFNNHSDFSNFQLKFTESHFYAKTKAHYIIPFKYSTAYFPNENQNQYFYIKIKLDQHNNSIKNNQYQCHILTDNHLCIQNYSANTFNLLGLPANSFNTPKEITEYIKELSGDYLDYYLKYRHSHHHSDFNDYSKEYKANFKLKVLLHKYIEPTAVTWVKLYQKDFNPNSFDYNNELSKITSVYLPNKSHHTQSFFVQKKPQDGNDKNVILHIKTISFSKDCKGIVFIIEPLWHYNMRTKTINPILSLNETITPLTMRGLKLSAYDIFDDKTSSKKKLTKGLRSRFSSKGVKDNKVDQDYIPDSNVVFRLDATKGAFLQEDIRNNNDSIKSIKEKAKEKYNNVFIIKKDTTTFSSIDELSDDDDSDSLTSNDNDHNDNSNYGNNGNGNDTDYKQIIKDNRDNDNYYNVNLTNIKYYIYDYTQTKMNEVTKYNKVSEVELKLKEEKNKINPSSPITTPINKRNNSINKYEFPIPAKGNETYKIYTQSNKTEGYQVNPQSLQKEILKKEIKSSLKTSNIQSTIYLFYFYSLLACLLIIFHHLLFLFEVLDIILLVDESTELIYSAVKLQNNILSAAYNIRELTLLNLPIYNTTIDRELYANLMKQNLNQSIYTDNILHIHDIITSKLQMTENQEKIMNSKGGLIFNLKKDYSVSVSKGTFQQCLNIVQTSIYHVLITELQDMISMNPDLFAFMYNALNPLMIGLNNQTENYFTNFDSFHTQIVIRMSLVTISCVIILFIGFFFVRRGLVNVSMKNESYLSVFLEIGREVILDSLEKCEAYSIHFFTKRNNTLYNDWNNKSDDDAYDNYSSHLSNKASLTVMKNNTTTTTNSNTNNCNNKASQMKKRKHKFYGRFIQAYIGLIIGISLMLVFDCYVLCKIISFKNETYRAISIYRSECIIQKQILLAPILIKEHAFDNNALFVFAPLNITIVPLLNLALDTYQIEKKNIESQLPLLPSKYSDNIYKINHQSICHYMKDEELCLYYSEGSAIYGLNTVIIHLLETVRNLYFRNYLVRKAQIGQGFKYNLSLYGTEEYDKLLPENPLLMPVYIKLGPMYVLNSEDAKKMQKILNLVMLPAFKELTTGISSTIEANIKTIKFFYIVTVASSIAVWIVLFAAIWFPFIKKINSTIYKTKNMLTIIPIDVLASLGNIYKLLEIDLAIDKNINRQMN